MARFPEIQRRAQEEIEKVVGIDRLPEFEDRLFLPYTEALFREVLRWHPIVPLSLAHFTTEEDYHNGYYIPKGAFPIVAL